MEEKRKFIGGINFQTFIFIYFFAVPVILSQLRDKNYSKFSFRIVTIIGFVTFITFGKAYLDADSFINGTKYKYVMGSDLKGSYPDKKLKLIGKADDHYFLKYADKETVIIKQFDDFKRLHLQTFRDTTDTD